MHPCERTSLPSPGHLQIDKYGKFGFVDHLPGGKPGAFGIYLNFQESKYR